MLAETASTALSPLTSSELLFEAKWDGYRALFFTSDKKLVSRNGKDLTQFFSHLIKVKLNDAVVDGEIICIKDNRPDFASLRKNPQSAIFMAFDLLYLQGKDLCNSPLEDRRKLLQDLIYGQKLIGFSPDYQDGLKLFQALSSSGWEGVMAKKKGSFYLPGKRSRDWLKIIAYKEVDAVVMEWFADKGTMLLGLYIHNKLQPIGHVFYSHKPQLSKKVVTVRYREFSGQALRHASIVRFRDDKSPKECKYEQLF